MSPLKGVGAGVNLTQQSGLTGELSAETPKPANINPGAAWLAFLAQPNKTSSPPELGLPPPDDKVNDTPPAHNAWLQQSGVPFDLSEVSTLFLEMMLTYRASARLERQSALEGQITQLLDSAQKTRDAAQSSFNAALAQGIVSIVGGAIQGAVGAFQLTNLAGMKQNIADRATELKSKPDLVDQTAKLEVGSSASAKSSKLISVDISADAASRASGSPATAKLDLLDQIEVAERASTRTNRMAVDLNANLPDTSALEKKFNYLQAHSQFLNGVNQSLVGLFVDGPGKIYSAFQTKDATTAQAAAQELDAQAKKFEAAYSTTSDQLQATRDMFNKVLDMVADIDRSRSETNKSIARI